MLRTSLKKEHFALLLLVGVSVFLFSLDSLSMLWSGISYSEHNPTFNRAYWALRIEHVGAEHAYKEFIQKNNTAPLGRQHFAAHVFGGELFLARGVDGISVCNSSFGFGCYHGLFARAISQGGIEIITALDTKCTEVYGPLGLGCQHGIGHGVVEYVGYDHIAEALELCRTHTSQPTPLLGCTSGVFMDFFSPLQETKDGLFPTSRTLSSSTPYEPCTDVASTFQASCYFELGQWLLSTQKPAITVCDSLSGDSRQYCFLGIGTATAHTEKYQVPEILTICGSLPENDALSCRAGAAWAFYSVPEQREHTNKLCAYEAIEQTRSCMMKADFTEGLDTNFTTRIP